eukprot:6192605-Pleurochrysis_carterae.AAC.2
MVVRSGGVDRQATGAVVGGVRIAFTSAKQHSVHDDSHRALTKSSESEKLGTHLTPLSVTLTSFPESFIAVTGKSPMAMQRCGLPSMPATWSQHAFTFTKSDM